MPFYLKSSNRCIIRKKVDTRPLSEPHSVQQKPPFTKNSAICGVISAPLPSVRPTKTIKQTN